MSYDARARADWAKRAEAQFATAALRSALEARTCELEQHAYRAYGASIEKLEARAQEQANAQAQAEQMLTMFQRDFKAELDREYSTLEEIKAEQRDCQEELDEAYGDLETAKDEIDSWYRKSERSGWLMGNSGRKLPKHSLFGQSFGDLDEYKEDRRRAAERIGELRAYRDSLNARFDTARSAITEIKRDRQRWFELRQAGETRARLESSLSAYRATRDQLRAEIKRLTGMRTAFLHKETSARGIDEIKRQIAELESKKKVFLSQFDEPTALAKRKAQHRKEWLAARGTPNA